MGLEGWMMAWEWMTMRLLQQAVCPQLQLQLRTTPVRTGRPQQRQWQ